MSVPDEGYSRNASCGLNLISTFLFSYINSLPKFKEGKSLNLLLWLYLDYEKVVSITTLVIFIKNSKIMYMSILILPMNRITSTYLPAIISRYPSLVSNVIVTWSVDYLLLSDATIRSNDHCILSMLLTVQSGASYRSTMFSCPRKWTQKLSRLLANNSLLCYCNTCINIVLYGSTNHYVGVRNNIYIIARVWPSYI